MEKIRVEYPTPTIYPLQYPTIYYEEAEKMCASNQSGLFLILPQSEWFFQGSRSYIHCVVTL